MNSGHRSVACVRTRDILLNCFFFFRVFNIVTLCYFFFFCFLAMSFSISIVWCNLKPCLGGIASSRISSDHLYRLPASYKEYNYLNMCRNRVGPPSFRLDEVFYFLCQVKNDMSRKPIALYEFHVCQSVKNFAPVPKNPMTTRRFVSIFSQNIPEHYEGSHFYLDLRKNLNLG